MAAVEQVYSPKADDKSTDVDDHDGDDEYYMQTSCVCWRAVGPNSIDKKSMLFGWTDCHSTSAYFRHV